MRMHVHYDESFIYLGDRRCLFFTYYSLLNYNIVAEFINIEIENVLTIHLLISNRVDFFLARFKMFFRIMAYFHPIFVIIFIMPSINSQIFQRFLCYCNPLG